MPPTDEALMAAYVGGDQDAFAELWRRYAPRILRTMRRDLPEADAQDLVQQTFLQLHRARRDFRLDAAVRPWLYTIALNLKRQHFRRTGRRADAKPSATYDPDGASDPTADPESRLADAQLRAQLASLPQAQREVIELHWFDGLSFKEVAEVVGATHAAVRVRAHRGYAKLREVLEHLPRAPAASRDRAPPVTDPRNPAYPGPSADR